MSKRQFPKPPAGPRACPERLWRDSVWNDPTGAPRKGHNIRMNAPMTDIQTNHRSRPLLSVLLISLGLLAFCALFLILDQAYFRFISSCFPDVGTSFWLATAWGIVSRAPWILVIATLAIIQPRLLALRAGEMRSRWRLRSRHRHNQLRGGRRFPAAERRAALPTAGINGFLPRLLPSLSLKSSSGGVSCSASCLPCFKKA